MVSHLSWGALRATTWPEEAEAVVRRLPGIAFGTGFTVAGLADMVVLTLPADAVLPGGVASVLLARPRFPDPASRSRLVSVVPATSFKAKVARPDEGLRSRFEVAICTDWLEARLAPLAVSGG